MNEQPRLATPIVCLVDDCAQRRALLRSVAVRLGLRFEYHEHWLAIQPAQFSRPACLVVGEHLLPSSSHRSTDRAIFGQSPAETQALARNPAEFGLSFRDNHPATIIISTSSSIAATVGYMRAGAVAVLPQPLDDQSLAGWIGEALLVDETRFRIFCRAQELAKTYALFSRRKQLVLRHMVEGRASKWSAQQLDVSRRTIELDRAEILAAFGASNAIELARTVGPWLEQQPWDSGPVMAVKPPERAALSS